MKKDTIFSRLSESICNRPICSDRLFCMLSMFPLINPCKIWTDRLCTIKH